MTILATMAISPISPLSPVQIFLCTAHICGVKNFRRSYKSLVIPYILFIYCLIIILTIMAHFTISNGIDGITGALKKTTPQGVDHITVTKKKHFHDPLTGEETGTGPNEIFMQNKRDYNEHPLTEGETKQRLKWKEACRLASVIVHDPSHPRYMEFYLRWREHVKNSETPMQFPNFIRAELIHAA